MQSSAKALGHPIHQQLVVFPLGLLATAVVFDVLRLITDHDGFATASYYMIAAGIVFGLLAAVFGTIDYTAVPTGTRARRIGAMHGLGNVVVVVLFAVSWLLGPGNRGTSRPPSRSCSPGGGPRWRRRPAGSVASWWTGSVWAWSRTRTWTHRRPSRPASTAPGRARAVPPGRVSVHRSEPADVRAGPPVPAPR